MSPLLFNNNLKIKKEKYRERNRNDSLLFNRSTQSIDFILKSIKSKNKTNTINLALPYFYCKSTINFLKENNKWLNIVFYDSAIKDNIDIIKINNDIEYDVLIIVHYFYEKKIIFNKKPIKNRFIIEDCTHLTEHNTYINNSIDFKIYSPYKFYPIPFLGLLLFNNKNKWIIFYYKQEDFLKDYLKNLYFYLKEDIYFIFKNLILSIYNFRKKKNITFENCNYERIKPNLKFPSILSRLLFNYFFFKKNNLYTIHNQNLNAIKQSLVLLNNTWEIHYQRNSYLCRIIINGYESNLLLINDLIKVGIPFMIWPDIDLNEKNISKYPKAYKEFTNNIYLPINISNNELEIKYFFQKKLNKYLNTFYSINRFNFKSFPEHDELFINLIKANVFSLNIYIKFEILNEFKEISINLFIFQENEEIFVNEKNLIIFKCLKFLNKKINKSFKLNSNISLINKIIKNY